MPNDVFRATDGVLILSVEDKNAPEGAAADQVITQYDLTNSVGRVRNVTIQVTSDLRPFYEIGRRYPTDIRAGAVRTSGTIERAHVNGALLRLLLGDGATSPPGSANFAQPSFNIIASLKDPARLQQGAKVIVFGAKFASWSYNLPTEDFVMEAVSFQALRVSFEES